MADADCDGGPDAAALPTPVASSVCPSHYTKHHHESFISEIALLQKLYRRNSAAHRRCRYHQKLGQCLRCLTKTPAVGESIPTVIDWYSHWCHLYQRILDHHKSFLRVSAEDKRRKRKQDVFWELPFQSGETGENSVHESSSSEESSQLTNEFVSFVRHIPPMYQTVVSRCIHVAQLWEHEMVRGYFLPLGTIVTAAIARVRTLLRYFMQDLIQINSGHNQYSVDSQNTHQTKSTTSPGILDVLEVVKQWWKPSNIRHSQKSKGIGQDIAVDECGPWDSDRLTAVVAGSLEQLRTHMILALDNIQSSQQLQALTLAAQARHVLASLGIPEKKKGEAATDPKKKRRLSNRKSSVSATPDEPGVLVDDDISGFANEPFSDRSLDLLAVHIDHCEGVSTDRPSVGGCRGSNLSRTNELSTSKKNYDVGHVIAAIGDKGATTNEATEDNDTKADRSFNLKAVVGLDTGANALSIQSVQQSLKNKRKAQDDNKQNKRSKAVLPVELGSSPKPIKRKKVSNRQNTCEALTGHEGTGLSAALSESEIHGLPIVNVECPKRLKEKSVQKQTVAKTKRKKANFFDDLFSK
jgi:hypothetical protein